MVDKKKSIPKKKIVADKITEQGNSKLNYFEIFLLIASFSLFVLLFVLLKELVSPLLVFVAIIILLLPLRKYIYLKNILIFTVCLFVFWLFYNLSGILFPFIFSIIFAYLFNPLVIKFENSGNPRWLSSLSIVLVFLFLIIVSVILILPIVISQIDYLISTLAPIVDNFTNPITSGKYDSWLESYGINSIELNKLIKEKFNFYIEDLITISLKGTSSLILGFVSLITSLLNLLIIPILIFYFLKDFNLILDSTKKIFNHKQLNIVSEIFSRVDSILKEYLRGTTLISIIDGILVSIFFWIIGVQYSVLLGICSAILYFAPYAGFLILLLLVSLITSLTPGTNYIDLMFSFSFLVTLHSIENYILVPKIIGKHIGLHPILIILSLFIFGYLFGFFGLLFAIPFTALLVLLISDWEIIFGKE
ncbi:MAG: AI-2E family transporter [Bacteroidetes bacterium]|nr:AI-2E family transporter [Bacteroidota bacterium]